MMEVKLSSEQSELIRAVKGELERALGREGVPLPGNCDLNLLGALDSAGFLDVLGAGGTAVDAVLIVEEAARTAPGLPVAGRAFVAPLVTERPLPRVVALAERPSGVLVRNALDAELFLGLDGAGAWVAPAAEATVEPVTTRWGYPVARVSVHRSEPLGEGAGEALLRAWQTALAAEVGGLMEAAVLHASRYVAERKQFGKPIGMLQSIQHRLARSYVLSQGAIWLARRAAWDTSDGVAAAAAATYATEGVREVMSTTHQVCGAIGITDEFRLTAYTARLALLQTELGGTIVNSRRLARARWGARIATRGTAQPAAVSVD
jgi:hypothetical protein